MYKYEVVAASRSRPSCHIASDAVPPFSNRGVVKNKTVCVIDEDDTLQVRVLFSDPRLMFANNTSPAATILMLDRVMVTWV